MAIFSRPKYNGTTLPAISEAVTLYTTPAIAGQASNFFSQSNVHKVVLDLVIDQSGTLTQQISGDGGTTWTTVSSESLAANSSNSHHREYATEGFQDFRLRFTNGGTAQTTFIVNVALSDNPINFGTVGTAAGGAAQAAADTMANPTEDGVLSYLLGFNGTTWDRIREAIVAKTATFTGLLNTLGMGRYNAAPPALTDGDVQLVQLDANGNARVNNMIIPGAEDNTNNVYAVISKPLASSTYAPSSFSNVGAATTATPKSAAGNLFSISALNINGAVRYLQLFDSTGSTATVVYEFTLPPASTIVIGNDFFTDGGIFFTTGITWGVSTTKGSYVAATATDHTVQGTYK